MLDHLKLKLARALMARGHVAASKKILLDLEPTPRIGRAASILLAENASATGDWDQAITRWMEIRSRADSTPPIQLPARLRRARLQRAEELIELHTFPQAETLLLDVLKDSPCDYTALTRLFLIAFKQAQWRKAVNYGRLTEELSELASQPLPKKFNDRFSRACQKHADELMLAGDHGAAAALRVLSGDPLAKKASPWHFPPISLLPKSTALAEAKVTHIGVFDKGNAGDHLLPILLRDLFHQAGGLNHWQLRAARREFTHHDIKKINASQGAIIGGGGLFLRDTGSNQNSGWQWNCSVSNLASIKVPLAVFAVGYNRFRGQPDFEPVFSEHLALLAEKSLYIGLRNHGSIDAIKSYLPASLHAKLRYQPCMTTLGRKLYPELCARASGAARPAPIVALNMAFDRSELRFRDGELALLSSVAEAVRRLATDTVVHLVLHCAEDLQIAPFLRAAKVSFEEIALHKASPEEIVAYYAGVDLAIGMRGHSQLIPFGCGTPFLSLITHDKMRWFLDDIGHAAPWGVELSTRGDLADEIHAKAVALLGSPVATRARIDEIQERLWRISTANASEFARVVAS